VDFFLGVVFPQPDNLIFSFAHDIVQIEFEVLCPFGDGQFIHNYRVLLGFVNIATSVGSIRVESLICYDLATKIFVPGMNDWKVFAFEFLFDDLA
jgi:hypothetical protein